MCSYNKARKPSSLLRYLRVQARHCLTEAFRASDNNFPRPPTLLTPHKYHHVCRFLTPVKGSSALYTQPSLFLDRNTALSTPRSIHTLHRILPIANMRMRRRASRLGHRSQDTTSQHNGTLHRTSPPMHREGGLDQQPRRRRGRDSRLRDGTEAHNRQRRRGVRCL